MKIAVFFPSRHLGEWSFAGGHNLNFAFSGTDRSLLWLVDGLVKEKNNVSLYSQTAPQKSTNRETHQAKSMQEAVRMASREKAEFLITPAHGDTVTLEGIKEAESQNLPLIIWAQNGPSNDLATAVHTFRCIKALVCVSELQADEIRHRRAFRKTQVIHNALDLSFWHPPAERKESSTVLYVGAASFSKGFHHVAKAWPGIRSKYPNAKLHVCGSARLHSRATSVGSLGIGEEAFEKTQIQPYLGTSPEAAFARGVIFEGLTSPVTIRNLIWKSSLGIVNPNIEGSRETFCVAAAEMQACALPVVGARAGGLPEIVPDGISGLLLNNPQRLASAVNQILGDPLLRLKLSCNGPKSASRFDQTRILGEWTMLLQRLKTNSEGRRIAFRCHPFTLRRLIKRTIQLCRLSH